MIPPTIDAVDYGYDSNGLWYCQQLPIEHTPNEYLALRVCRYGKHSSNIYCL